MNIDTEQEQDDNEFNQAFEESVRLKEIKYDIELVKSLPEQTVSDRSSKEESLRVLVKESQAIKDWLNGKRDSVSEWDDRLPKLLRSKTARPTIQQQEEKQGGEYITGREALCKVFGYKLSSFNAVVRRVNAAGMKFDYTEESYPRPRLRTSDIEKLKSLKKNKGNQKIIS